MALLRRRDYLDDESDDYNSQRDYEKLETKLEESREYLKCLMDILYGDEEYEEDKVEFLLEELCSQLDIKFKASNLKIQKKG